MELTAVTVLIINLSSNSVSEASLKRAISNLSPTDTVEFIGAIDEPALRYAEERGCAFYKHNLSDLATEENKARHVSWVKETASRLTGAIENSSPFLSRHSEYQWLGAYLRGNIEERLTELRKLFVLHRKIEFLKPNAAYLVVDSHSGPESQAIAKLIENSNIPLRVLAQAAAKTHVAKVRMVASKRSWKIAVQRGLDLAYWGIHKIVRGTKRIFAKEGARGEVLVMAIRSRTDLENALTELNTLRTEVAIFWDFTPLAFSLLRRGVAMGFYSISLKGFFRNLYFKILGWRESKSVRTVMLEHLINDVARELSPLVKLALGNFHSDTLLKQMAAFHRAAKSHILSAQPKLITLPYARGIQGELIEKIAEDSAIPTVLLPNHFDLLWKEPPLLNLSNQYSHIVTPSSIDRETLLAMGGSAQRIHLARIQKYDWLIEQTRAGNLGPYPQTVRQQGFKGYFLYVSQGLKAEEPGLSALSEIMQSYPDFLLWLREHPFAKESPKISPEWNNVTKAPHASLHSLIQGARAVITYTSTTAYDAVLADKPVIVANFTDEIYPFFLPQEGVVLTAYDAQSLKKYLDALTKEGSVSEALAAKRESFGKHHYDKSPAVPFIHERIQSLLS